MTATYLLPTLPGCSDDDNQQDVGEYDQHSNDDLDRILPVPEVLSHDDSLN